MSAFARLAGQIAKHSPGPVFGVPGSGATLSVIDELDRLGREFILTNFEGAAAMMAGTVGRLSGRAGTCLSIKGPGVINMMPGLGVSAFEAFPLVAIVEAYGRDVPAAKMHKRIDQAALTATVSKAITQLAEQGPSFQEIAAFAEAETPGPVILELAQPQPAQASLPPLPGAPAADGAAALVGLIEKSRYPIVVAGSMAIRQNLSAALNRLKVPVFSTASAKGIVDEAHPLSAGVYTGVGLELSPEHGLFKTADLVVCFGMRPNEVLATRPFGPPAANIVAGVDPGAEAFGFQVTAAPSAAKDALAALEQKSWGADRVSEAQQRLRRSTLSNRFLPAHVYDRTQAFFGGKVRGVFDTGYFCTIAEHIWLARESSLCLMSGQARYMGTGIPMALGAAIHDQSVPTVVFVGDGGIGPFIAEAKLAVERRLPLLFCLLTDGYLSSIRTRALTEGLSQRAVTIARPSWLGVMEGFGMPVFSADDEESFGAALPAWRPAEGPAFVEVSFEPDSYEAMVKGIR